MPSSSHGRQIDAGIPAKNKRKIDLELACVGSSSGCWPAAVRSSFNRKPAPLRAHPFPLGSSICGGSQCRRLQRRPQRLLGKMRSAYRCAPDATAPQRRNVRRVQLDCLNHSIPRRNRAHPQIVAGNADRLVVARVHLRLHPVHRQKLVSLDPSSICTGCASTTSRPG